jgi:hypothetical protein
MTVSYDSASLGAGNTFDIDSPGQGVIAITPDVTARPGRFFSIACTVAGNVNITFPDASTHTVPVTVGYTILPYAVVKVNSGSTTATATYANVR